MAELRPAEWFDAATGRAAVDASGGTSPRTQACSDRQDEVAEALVEIADALAAAESAGVRFRLAVVP